MLPDDRIYKRSKRISDTAYDLLEETREYTNWSEDGTETLDEIVEELYSALNKASSASQTKKRKNKITTLLKRLDKNKDKIAEEIFFNQTRPTRKFYIRLEDDTEIDLDENILIDFITLLDEYIEDENIFPEIKVENIVYSGEEKESDYGNIEQYGSDADDVSALPIFIQDILGKEILELIETQDEYRTEIDDSWNTFDESKRDEWNRKYGKYLDQEEIGITAQDEIIIDNLSIRFSTLERN